jgi:hypothetical protein
VAIPQITLNTCMTMQFQVQILYERVFDDYHNTI